MLILFFILQALEIDETLTCRILKISQSKRTIAINRGREDGLQIGDHAKIFITQGIIARALLVRLEAQRSIWSVYRIIERDLLAANLVANIKISIPVPLTEDATKGYNYPYSLSAAHPKSNYLPNHLTPSLQEVDKSISEQDFLNQDLEDIDLHGQSMQNSTPKQISLESRFLEFFLVPSFSIVQDRLSLLDSSSQNNAIKISLRLGGEYFLYSLAPFLQRSSLLVFLHLSNQQLWQVANRHAKSSAILGVGSNFYYPNLPLNRLSWRPYVGVNLGIGISQGTFTDNNINQQSARTLLAEIALGCKYNFNQQLALGASYGYFYESSLFSSENSAYKVDGGFRLQVMGSYAL